MKKLIIVGLAVLAAFSLAACSGGNIADPKPTQGAVDEIIDMMTKAPEATEVPVLTPTPDILDPTAEPTQEPTAE